MSAVSPTNMPDDVQLLKCDTIIGSNGKVPCGLIVHPDKQNIIYGLGCTVIIEDMVNHKQDLLSEHTNDVTTIAVSKSGRYIASGQKTYMGFHADVIIWDYALKSLYCKFSGLHKVEIKAVAFSPNDLYLVTLGGQDDGSIIVWNIESRQPICGAPAQVESAGSASCVAFANRSDNLFVSAGKSTLRVWELNVENRKIVPTDVNMGKLKRDIQCMQMTDDDSFVYCGTSSGDLLAINVTTKLYQQNGPEKDRFSLGVTSLALLKSGDILVGAGDSTIAMVGGMSQKFKRKPHSKKLTKGGKVTSIALRGEGHQFFCGTDKAHMYQFNLHDFKETLIRTGHFSSINDVAFPHDCSLLFGTCSYEEIRIWNLQSKQEIRRIIVSNMTCNAIEFSRDGRYIASAWDDGIVRGFLPESGKTAFEIANAQTLGVTALAIHSNCWQIITGGGEGKVKVWQRQGGQGSDLKTWNLKHSLHEHQSRVNCIKMSVDNMQCVTSSDDGSCIIWNLQSYKREQIIFANTMFKCVAFFAEGGPKPCQIITGGTDRKVAYWDILDSQLVREYELAHSDEILGIDISADGKHFVTGSRDKLIKVWSYEQGKVTHIGKGHAQAVNKVKICPKKQFIVSVSADGAIYIWPFPNI